MEKISQEYHNKTVRRIINSKNNNETSIFQMARINVYRKHLFTIGHNVTVRT